VPTSGWSHLINVVVQQVPWFGTHTDTVAVSVVISAIIVRFGFGRTGLVGLAGRSGGTGAGRQVTGRPHRPGPGASLNS
jgi:hypothetical protein